MIDDSQLAEYLLSQEALSDQQLRRGIDRADDQELGLYETLVAAELIDERSLVKLVAKMLDVSPVWLGDRQPDSQATSQVPRSLAVRTDVLPVKLDTREDPARLVLAMADPLDDLAINEVALHTGLNIQPVLAGPADLAEGLQRTYGEAADTGFEGPSSIGSAAPTPSNPQDSRGPDHSNPVPPSNCDDHDDDALAKLFDSPRDDDQPRDSESISRAMQSRSISDTYEAITTDDDDADGEASDGHDDSLRSLDKPLTQSQITGGVPPDLEQWEIDDASDVDEHPDYAKIGHLFVHSPRQAAERTDPPADESPPAASDSSDPSSPPERPADEQARSTTKNRAAVLDKIDEMNAAAPRRQSLSQGLNDLADLDSTHQQLLDNASPDELLHALILALAESEVVDVVRLVELIEGAGGES